MIHPMKTVADVNANGDWLRINFLVPIRYNEELIADRKTSRFPDIKPYPELREVLRNIRNIAPVNPRNIPKYCHGDNFSLFTKEFSISTNIGTPEVRSWDIRAVVKRTPKIKSIKFAIQNIPNKQMYFQY